jgi:hypothetical protein
MPKEKPYLLQVYEKLDRVASETTGKNDSVKKASLRNLRDQVQDFRDQFGDI